MKEIITKYTIRFESGHEITKTSREGFKNRLDVYNWACRKKLGQKHGRIEEITAGSF